MRDRNFIGLGVAAVFVNIGLTVGTIALCVYVARCAWQAAG